MVGVVQLANTSDCGSEDREFESPRPPHKNIGRCGMNTDAVTGRNGGARTQEADDEYSQSKLTRGQKLA